MRTIPDDLLDLIAGGRKVSSWSSSTTSVTIVGERPEAPWFTPGWGDGGGGWDGGGDAGGEGGGGGEPHHGTPVPQYAPANVNMDTLRNTVLAAAEQLKAMTAKDGVEHGCFIIRNADGSLKIGPISSGTEDEIKVGYDVRAGEKIVAWVHDHPETIGMDERMPSKTDISSFQQMVKISGVDPNALMYIVDMERADTYEYQKTVRAGSIGSDISKDM